MLRGRLGAHAPMLHWYNYCHKHWLQLLSYFLTCRHPSILALDRQACCIHAGRHPRHPGIQTPEIGRYALYMQADMQACMLHRWSPACRMCACGHAGMQA